MRQLWSKLSHDGTLLKTKNLSLSMRKYVQQPSLSHSRRSCNLNPLSVQEYSGFSQILR
uniref:Uncharacterized protein n=1 Tax=Kalanchoe fedtschenkoi TaxID=63787 RepID=A0A7N0UHH3_KALFE